MGTTGLRVSAGNRTSFCVLVEGYHKCNNAHFRLSGAIVGGGVVKTVPLAEKGTAPRCDLASVDANGSARGNPAVLLLGTREDSALSWGGRLGLPSSLLKRALDEGWAQL